MIHRSIAWKGWVCTTIAWLMITYGLVLWADKIKVGTTVKEL